MRHNKELFSKLEVLSKPSIVTLPNGKCVHVTHTSNVVFSSSLVLNGVLYVPSFKYNILSVSKLSTQLNGYIIFTPQHCLMQTPLPRKPQVLGELYAGLYLFKPSSAVNSDAFVRNFPILSLNTQSSVCNASMFSQDLWHARLGHLPFTKLQKLGLLSSHTSIDSIKECLICSKARQHRFPFPHSQIHSTQVFKLIHIDLWGPYRVQTYNGYKYFFNYSR